MARLALAVAAGIVTALIPGGQAYAFQVFALVPCYGPPLVGLSDDSAPEAIPLLEHDIEP